MKRLLCIVSSMDRGGAETFLMKIYRCLDKTKYQMDFCVFKKHKGYYDDEIKKMGGKIYYIVSKSEKPIKSFIGIKRLVKKENYKYVLRTSQQSLAALDLLAAKMGGAKTLIYRSSNAGIVGGKFKVIINNIISFLPKIIPTVKFAPSTEAADFVFGKNSIKSNKAFIIHNAINYDYYSFDKKTRNNIRKKLNINNDCILYGHVGRFNAQKNHKFLLEIFKEINNKQPNSMLLLIGEGEEKNKILKIIKDEKLEKKVIILGPQKNVNEYYMAMDKLIFPSFFEGMPNVIIEAQASGLSCFVSSTITKEANITGLITYIDLNKTSKEWSEIILSNGNDNRKDTRLFFEKNKYLIEQIVEEFVAKCY